MSVHLSVTPVYCVKTTELIIKQLALDSSLGTLVYGCKHEQIFRGSHSSGMLRRRGCWKVATVEFTYNSSVLLLSFVLISYPSQLAARMTVNVLYVCVVWQRHPFPQESFGGWRKDEFQWLFLALVGNRKGIHPQHLCTNYPSWNIVSLHSINQNKFF